MPASVLTADEVVAIKADLWSGATAAAVAARLKVSVDTIRAIASGRRWNAVEWPNGSKGGISKARRAEIAKLRRGKRGK
jgi:hypothetical protein